MRLKNSFLPGRNFFKSPFEKIVKGTTNKWITRGFH